MQKAQEYKALLKRSENFGLAQVAKVEEGFANLYKSIGFKAPQVICFDSPFQLQLAIKWALRKPLSLRINNDAFKSLEFFLERHSVGDRINSRIWHNVGENAARALKLAYAKEDGLLALHSRLKPTFQMVEKAVQQKLEQDLSQAQAHVELFAHHPHYFDLKWLLHYQNNLEEMPLAAELYDIIDAGLMYGYNFQNLVLWCPLPKEVNFDENLELHAEFGPSLSWNSHFQTYHWKGVKIPAKLIEAPELVNKSDLVRHRNAEVRRCFQEILGSERFASLFDLYEVDRDKDLSGNWQFLLRSRHIDSVAKEHLQFAKVTCPTSGRSYFLAVPPEITNIWQAVAWTFDKTAPEYKPKAEY